MTIRDLEKRIWYEFEDFWNKTIYCMQVNRQGELIFYYSNFWNDYVDQFGKEIEQGRAYIEEKIIPFAKKTMPQATLYINQTLIAGG